ncbi:hypothetical protein AVEN_7259-1 [Araneus ventricosus]|uniref:Uncharacterized protein n=1 Tax=Araneus ventricosus TaxID=182803 RepID=A0A4Y2S8A4_ARAVE|nr:hypothetical protein AVEN_7259-1 [Araneus ventricosus]
MESSGPEAATLPPGHREPNRIFKHSQLEKQKSRSPQKPFDGLLQYPPARLVGGPDVTAQPGTVMVSGTGAWGGVLSQLSRDNIIVIQAEVTKSTKTF